MFYYTFGIRGIWVGPTAAVVLITAAYQIIVSKTDWQKLIHEGEKSRALAKTVEESEPSPVKTNDNDDDYEKANTMK